MKLTNELFERGKNQKEICSIIDDEYVLLKKLMPCTDDKLQDYIDLIKKAKEEGVNIAQIVDYKLIDETTCTFGDKSYTTGVFLEERAKGSQMPEFKIPIKSTTDLWAYQTTVNDYITELEKRASADQSIYDKYLEDFLKLNDMGIIPDPKPLNVFFDENKGYSIIDVIDSKQNNNQYFVSYILMGVFGYGIPHTYQLSNSYYSFTTKSRYKKYEEACKTIFEKVTKAAKKYQIEEEYIKNDLKRMNDNCFANTLVIDDKDLNIFIENFDLKNNKNR
ncbi:MAG: hypothetical protein IKX00_01380 [Bacilli bacterium]|nr:hypothetical protein [Bacilli bacterium]